DRPPPQSRLFPYTTLFRSDRQAEGVAFETLGGDGDGRDHDIELLDLETGKFRSPRNILVNRLCAEFLGDAVEEILRHAFIRAVRSEEHTSELQSRENLVCR